MTSKPENDLNKILDTLPRSFKFATTAKVWYNNAGELCIAIEGEETISVSEQYLYMTYTNF